jgi:hypothetical protein
MNRTDAKKIAETISNQELFDMFEKAKVNVKDWTKKSNVNKGLTKGTSWNILGKDFNINFDYHILAKINMIREFGEYLPDNMKPVKKKPINTTLYHQEPIFFNKNRQ